MYSILLIIHIFLILADCRHNLAISRYLPSKFRFEQSATAYCDKAVEKAVQDFQL